MGQTDLAINLLAQLFQSDLVPALLAKHRVEVLGSQPSRLQLVERQTDRVVRARIDGVESIVHVEFQTQHDSRVPARVLAYNALLRQRYHPLPVRSMVVYLMHDRKRAVPRGIRRRRGDEQVEFTYDVWCVWEQAITLEQVRRQPALAPLAVLSPGLSPAEVAALPRVLRRTRLAPEALGPLLTVTFTLAGRRHGPDVLRSFLESRIMLESWSYRHIVEQGEARGRVVGQAEGLTKLVRHRLGRLPRGLQGKLEALDAEALGQLFDRVLEAEDPAELRALLAALPRR